MDAARLSHVNASLESRGAGYAAPTPDGTHLLVRAGSDGAVVDLATGEDVATFRADGPLAPAPSPDGSFFAAIDREEVHVRRLPDADLVHALPAPDVLRVDGRNVLAPGGTVVYLPGPPFPPGDWTRYRTATGEAEGSYPGVGVGDPWGAAVRAFAAADGETVAVAGATGPVGGGFVTVYDAVSGEVEETRPLAGEGDDVALSPDGSAVVAVSDLRTLVGDAWTESVPEGRVVDLDFVRDGRRVLVATDRGRLALRDAATGEVVATYGTDSEAHWMRAAADASLVALGGPPARLVAPDW